MILCIRYESLIPRYVSKEIFLDMYRYSSNSLISLTLSSSQNYVWKRNRHWRRRSKVISRRDRVPVNTIHNTPPASLRFCTVNVKCVSRSGSKLAYQLCERCHIRLCARVSRIFADLYNAALRSMFVTFTRVNIIAGGILEAHGLDPAGNSSELIYSSLVSDLSVSPLPVDGICLVRRPTMKRASAASTGDLCSSSEGYNISENKKYVQYASADCWLIKIRMRCI